MYFKLRRSGTVKERGSGNFAKFLFEVEAAEPHQIANIGLQLIPRPGDAPAVRRLSEPDAIAALKAELEKAAAAGRDAAVKATPASANAETQVVNLIVVPP